MPLFDEPPLSRRDQAAGAYDEPPLRVEINLGPLVRTKT